jgi:hypothetical protein
MESNMDSLQQEIKQQTERFNDLRKLNVAAERIREAREKLSDLKRLHALSKGADAGKDSGGKKRERLLLKTAKVRRYSTPSWRDLLNILKPGAFSPGRERAIMVQEKCTVANILKGS